MTSHRLVTLVVSLFVTIAAWGGEALEKHWAFSELAPVKICDAVAGLRPGDRVPVVVRVVVFTLVHAFDSQQRCCSNGVASTIYLRYENEAQEQPIFPEYERLVQAPGPPVSAVLEGVLEARPLPKDKEFYPEMPMKLRAVVNYTNRVRSPESRDYAATLRVYRIRSFEPASLEALDALDEQCQAPEAPIPLNLDLPPYPKYAHYLNYQGDVLVLVKVEGGKVVSAKLQVGDAVVAEEALRNVRTWRFDESVNTAFTVRYKFRLEERDVTREGLNPRYELRLPYEVTVIAPWHVKW